MFFQAIKAMIVYSRARPCILTCTLTAVIITHTCIQVNNHTLIICWTYRGTRFFVFAKYSHSFALPDTYSGLHFNVIIQTMLTCIAMEANLRIWVFREGWEVQLQKDDMTTKRLATIFKVSNPKAVKCGDQQWSQVVRRGGCKTKSKKSRSESRERHNVQHEGTEVKGAHCIWGTMKTTTPTAIKSTLQHLAKIPEEMVVKEKFKIILSA